MSLVRIPEEIETVPNQLSVPLSWSKYFTHAELSKSPSDMYIVLHTPIQSARIKRVVEVHPSDAFFGQTYHTQYRNAVHMLERSHIMLQVKQSNIPGIVIHVHIGRNASFYSLYNQNWEMKKIYSKACVVAWLEHYVPVISACVRICYLDDKDDIGSGGSMLSQPLVTLYEINPKDFLHKHPNTLRLNVRDKSVWHGRDMFERLSNFMNVSENFDHRGKLVWCLLTTFTHDDDSSQPFSSSSIALINKRQNHIYAPLIIEFSDPMIFIRFPKFNGLEETYMHCMTIRFRFEVKRESEPLNAFFPVHPKEEKLIRQSLSSSSSSSSSSTTRKGTSSFVGQICAYILSINARDSCSSWFDANRGSNFMMMADLICQKMGTDICFIEDASTVRLKFKTKSLFGQASLLARSVERVEEKEYPLSFFLYLKKEQTFYEKFGFTIQSPSIQAAMSRWFTYITTKKVNDLTHDFRGWSIFDGLYQIFEMFHEFYSALTLDERMQMGYSHITPTSWMMYINQFAITYGLEAEWNEENLMFALDTIRFRDPTRDIRSIGTFLFQMISFIEQTKSDKDFFQHSFNRLFLKLNQEEKNQVTIAHMLREIYQDDLNNMHRINHYLKKIDSTYNLLTQTWIGERIKLKKHYPKVIGTSTSRLITSPARVGGGSSSSSSSSSVRHH